MRYPRRVDSLVLIDAVGYPDPRPGGMTVLDLGRVPVLSRVLSRLTPRFLIAAGVRESYAEASKVSDEVIDRYWQLLLRPGNRPALLAGLNQRHQPQHDAIATLEQPALVMWGREDRLISVDLAERFHHDLPNSELVIYDDVGHLPMEEIPRRSAADTRDFLLGLRNTVP